MTGTTCEALTVHYWPMGKKPKKREKSSGERYWYVREWLKVAGLKQVHLIRATGWSKGRVSDLVNEVERWNRDELFAFAKVIKCPPGALLFDPSTEHGRMRALLLLGGDQLPAA